MEWIVDSGTTFNMTNNRDNIKHFKKLNTKIGVAKVNESMIAEDIGCLEFRNCRLKEVVYIPELSKNLLSVNVITSNGGEVLFTDKDVTVRFNNKKILKGQKLSNRLYQIKMEIEEEKETYLTENKEFRVKLA